MAEPALPTPPLGIPSSWSSILLLPLMPSSRLGACLFNALAFTLAAGLVYWTLTSWTPLPTWLVIAATLLACLLLLTLWGWFLGPQGGPPVTKRDHRIMERRANYDTPGKRLLVSESFEAAALVTVQARAYRAPRGCQIPRPSSRPSATSQTPARVRRL